MDELGLHDRREAAQIMGEMAASRLHDLIHERFETLAERDGLTQATLARRLGIPEQQLSRWFKEPRNMTVKSAGRLLGALDAHLIFDLDTFECIVTSSNCAAATTSAHVVPMQAVWSDPSAHHQAVFRFVSSLFLCTTEEQKKKVSYGG